MKEINKQRIAVQKERNKVRNIGSGSSFLQSKRKKLTGRLKEV